MSNTLTIKNLTCERNDRTLFQNLNFGLNPGQILQIKGANGSGKTSLLRIIAGLLTPQAGEVYWQTKTIQKAYPDYVANMTYLGHQLGIKANLTPLENLQFTQALENNPSSINWAEIFSQIKLQQYQTQLCKSLSAGQQKRVALARFMVRNTKLWLLDEPFSALDKDGIELLETMLVKHTKSGGMVVLTSHQPIQLKDIPFKQLSIDAAATA